jgi:hypothetical protein
MGQIEDLYLSPTQPQDIFVLNSHKLNWNKDLTFISKPE